MSLACGPTRSTIEALGQCQKQFTLFITPRVSCVCFGLGVCRIGGWHFLSTASPRFNPLLQFSWNHPWLSESTQNHSHWAFTRNTHKCLRMRVTKQPHPLLSPGPTPKNPTSNQTHAVGGQSSGNALRKRATSCILSGGVRLKCALVTIAFIFIPTLGCGVST